MQTNKNTPRQKTGRQIYIGSETEDWADRHTNTDRQKDRQTDKQKDRHELHIQACRRRTDRTKGRTKGRRRD